jgi:hypothetical protein
VVARGPGPAAGRRRPLSGPVLEVVAGASPVRRGVRPARALPRVRAEPGGGAPPRHGVHEPRPPHGGGRHLRGPGSGGVLPGGLPGRLGPRGGLGTPGRACRRAPRLFAEAVVGLPGADPRGGQDGRAGGEGPAADTRPGATPGGVPRRRPRKARAGGGATGPRRDRPGAADRPGGRDHPRRGGHAGGGAGETPPGGRALRVRAFPTYWWCRTCSACPASG